MRKKVPLPTAVLLGTIAVYFGSSAFALLCQEMRCDFEREFCRWTDKSLGGFSHIFKGNNGYACLYVYYAGTTGRLSSPWLDSQPGHTCQLRYRYYMGGNGTSGCQLSVIQEMENNVKVTVWRTTEPAGSRDANSVVSFSRVQDAPLACQNGASYRVHFVGERLDTTGGACGLYPEIGIDDISCIATELTTTTTTTTTRKMTTTSESSSTTTLPPTTLSTLSDPNSSNPDGPASDVGLGAVAGIVLSVIGVVAIVSAAVVVIVVVRRHHNSGNKDRSLHHNTESPTPLPRESGDPTDGNHGYEVVAASRQNVGRPEGSGDAPNDLNAAANADDEDAASHYIELNDPEVNGANYLTPIASARDMGRPEASGDAHNDLNAAANADDEDPASHYMELNPVDYTEVSAADYLTPIASAQDYVHGTDNAHHVYEETSRGRPESHVYTSLNKK